MVPINWKGYCIGGFLASPTRIHLKELPSGIMRTMWGQYQNTRRVRCPNRLTKDSLGLHKFLSAIIPIWGITDLQNTILNISKALKDIENATMDAITAIQTEVISLSKIVLQNQMALDSLTAKEGGVCMIVNQSCAYVDKTHRVETDLQTIWEKYQVFHQVTQYKSLADFLGIWDML